MARQEASDEVVYLRSAGLDLGKRFLVACVRVPHPSQAGRWLLETEKFGTIPREIRRLAAVAVRAAGGGRGLGGHLGLLARRLLHPSAGT